MATGEFKNLCKWSFRAQAQISLYINAWQMTKEFKRNSGSLKTKQNKTAITNLKGTVQWGAERLIFSNGLRWVI